MKKIATVVFVLFQVGVNVALLGAAARSTTKRNCCTRSVISWRGSANVTDRKIVLQAATMDFAQRSQGTQADVRALRGAVQFRQSHPILACIADFFCCRCCSSRPASVPVHRGGRPGAVPVEVNIRRLSHSSVRGGDYNPEAFASQEQSSSSRRTPSAVHPTTPVQALDVQTLALPASTKVSLSAAALASSPLSSGASSSVSPLVMPSVVYIPGEGVAMEPVVTSPAVLYQVPGVVQPAG